MQQETNNIDNSLDSDLDSELKQRSQGPPKIYRSSDIFPSEPAEKSRIDKIDSIFAGRDTRSRAHRSYPRRSRVGKPFLWKPESRPYSDESQFVTSEKFDKLIIGDDNRFDVVRDLMHAREHCCLIDKFTCMNAALNGNLELIKWARQMGCEWDELTCSGAAMNGHLHVLKWLHENGCPWDKYVCQLAAEDGHLETLKWARENGCAWDEYTCTYAARNGHLKVLQWARENGCNWDEETCANAAFNGDLEILKWARENGCEWDKDLCIQAAERNNHVEVVEWIKNN